MGLPALALGVLLGGLKEVWVMNLIHLIVPRHEEGARQGFNKPSPPCRPIILFP